MLIIIKSSIAAEEAVPITPTLQFGTSRFLQAHADLDGLYRQEVLPVFAAAGQGDEARSYVATTLDRFANPFLAHRLSDIAASHAEKVRRRIAAFVDWGEALGITAPQPRLRGVIARTGTAK